MAEDFIINNDFAVYLGSDNEYFVFVGSAPLDHVCHARRGKMS